MIPLLSLLGPVIGKVLDLIPDPAKRAQAKAEAELAIRDQEQKLLDSLLKADQSQVDVNKVEAAHSSLFVSGWRPFVGWTCGAGFAWATVIQPVLVFLLAAFHHSMVTPQIQTEVLIQALFGLLGMGAMRSFEKIKGVASK